MIVLPASDTLDTAIRILQEGGLIGLPTETVYGLAADATQDMAVARIFEKKKRPHFNPLIIHGSSKEVFQECVIWDDRAEMLANAFWPGPLTLVLPRKTTSPISLLASAGLDSLAVRVPRHPLALELLQKGGFLLAAPSANPSGKVSSTSTSHVEEDFPDLFILEGGDTVIGLESTILDLTTETPRLLRPGGLSHEEIEEVIGPLEMGTEDVVKAPGMTKSHYAPGLSLRLNAEGPLPGEAFLAFGSTSYKGDNVLNLSESGNLTEAASNLFKMLRLLDQPSFQAIAVAPIPSQGLGLALNDRLRRAAAPREP